ncbi:MAG: diguanylate cyclase [Aestuariibacter sp.]
MVAGLAAAFAQQQPNPKLTYCIDTDWLPYEALQDGQHVGMSKDYLYLVAEKAGIDLQLLNTSSWQESIRHLKNGKCHLTPFLNRSPNREQYLEFSHILFEAPNVIITHGDGIPIPSLAVIKNEKVGAVRGYRLHEYITQSYPDVPVYEVPSEIAGIRLLAAGDIDVMVGSMHTIVEHIQKNGLHNLRITGWLGLDDELRIGVGKDHVHLLESINKAISEISATQHNEIYRRWNNVKVVKEVDYGLLIKVVIPILLLTIILLVRHFMAVRYGKRIEQKNKELLNLQASLKNKNNKLHYLSTHDPLTDLYNRVQISAEAEELIRRKKRGIHGCSLVFIDIDDFKYLNDHFGHNIGDSILKQFADVVKKCIRETDIIGRWGGDEFVVLCPGASLDEAQHFANRLQGALDQATFEQGANVKCSIGLSELAIEDSLKQWLERADNAMYEAKSSGKHCVKTQ